MDEREKDDPLRELGERLAKAQAAAKRPEPRTSQPSTGSALAYGWRIGIELIGAIAIASFIGWAIDRWLGTRPWGMVVFFLLGMAAGMLNVYRAVTGLGGAVGYKRDGITPPPATWDEDEE